MWCKELNIKTKPQTPKTCIGKSAYRDYNTF